MTFHLPLATSDEPISIKKFWEITFLYHNSPHLVNRRILGVSQLFFLEVKFNDLYKIKDVLNYDDVSVQVKRNNFSKDNIVTIFELNTNKTETFDVDFDTVRNGEGIYVSARTLLPRNTKVDKGIEIVLIGNNQSVVKGFVVLLLNVSLLYFR